jgi:hypothetical protein
MEIAGVALSVPIPNERAVVMEVKVIAEPASSIDRAILFSGLRLRFVSCHAPLIMYNTRVQQQNNISLLVHIPSITYVSSTPIANARKGTTVTLNYFIFCCV